MLRFDLRAVSEGNTRTDALVPIDDPFLADVEFRLAEPVAVRGRLTESGPGRYYWHGSLTTRVAAICRRCLRDVSLPVDVAVSALFAEDAAVADDASTYAIPPGAIDLDLSEAVREELILAVPEYVVCREDCRGLCPQCGKALNEGPCACRREPDPQWAALEALKGRWADTEES